MGQRNVRFPTQRYGGARRASGVPACAGRRRPGPPAARVPLPRRWAANTQAAPPACPPSHAEARSLLFRIKCLTTYFGPHTAGQSPPVAGGRGRPEAGKRGRRAPRSRPRCRDPRTHPPAGRRPEPGPPTPARPPAGAGAAVPSRRASSPAPPPRSPAAIFLLPRRRRLSPWPPRSPG